MTLRPFVRQRVHDRRGFGFTFYPLLPMGTFITPLGRIARWNMPTGSASLCVPHADRPGMVTGFASATSLCQAVEGAVFSRRRQKNDLQAHGIGGGTKWPGAFQLAPRIVAAVQLLRVADFFNA